MGTGHRPAPAEGHGVVALPNGHFMIAGYTQSNDGDVQNFIGVRDVWLIELGEEDLATGLPQASQVSDLIAMPNPTNGLLRLSGDIGANTSYTVINAMGAAVLSNRLQGHDRTIDLSALPPGPYMLNGNSAEGTFCLRVVKE